ncbi:MAG: hypothetical protein ABIR32_10160 [Ilumatobacteraceae bacterium]
MGITSRATEPLGVTNLSGQPEIVLEIEGLTLSMAPPKRIADEADEDEDEATAD